MKPIHVTDVVVGGAVVAAWTSQVRDDLSILVSVLAAIYYIYGLYRLHKQK